MNTLHIAKERGRFDLQPILDYLFDLPDGNYSVKVKTEKEMSEEEKRSIEQNNYLWGVAYPAVLRGLIDVGFDNITNKEQVHEAMKNEFLNMEAINKHTGQIITYPLSTARMSKLQFSTYVDQIIDFAREYLGIIVPPPDKKKIKP